MGLDMKPLPAPKAGQEAAFDRVLTQFVSAVNGPPEASGFWARLFNRAPKVDLNALAAEFQFLSDPHFSRLGAPVVGTDPEADAWVRDLFEQGKLAGSVSNAQAALESFDGYYVLELLPKSDGIPYYSNGGFYSGIDICSFRGSFLNDCADILDEDTIAQAWTFMNAADLAAYGAQLSDTAARYAKTHGVEAVIGARDATWTEHTSPEAQAHIVDSLARWAAFWSAKGHGSEPDY